MAAKKFYVVWKGFKPGVYLSWNDCKNQIDGYKGAQYKSYKTNTLAQKAFLNGKDISDEDQSNASIITASLSVDAACSGNPGVMEYQGVNTQTKEQVFHQKFPQGTNNIGEFLALVHGLAFLQQQKSTIPVYSDSKIAIGWVQKKACKTKLPPAPINKRMFEMITRAEKWETKEWGEIPADFGRK